MSRFLLVVHRYYPFPGGSEIYVRNIAEEMVERGHDVTVLAATHDPEALKAGYLNGVKISNNHNIIMDKFDLIVVHGGDVSSQNVVHKYAGEIPSPVLYMLIKPSESPICLNGLKHNAIGCSANEDWDYCEKYDVMDKAYTVRHGIRVSDCLSPKPKRDKINYAASGVSGYTLHLPHYNIVSVGGFWPHKGMDELASIFKDANHPNMTLSLYGYDCQHLAPIASNNIHVYFGKSRIEILNAIRQADLLVMNSTEEGFGLVLLEAMLNETPWAARNIAGARQMADFGIVYEDAKFLREVFQNMDKLSTKGGKHFVLNHHTIRNTVDDIEKVLIRVK
jgi:glycosyltransferase involved in cell wall biosynthesis